MRRKIILIIHFDSFFINLHLFKLNKDGFPIIIESSSQRLPIKLNYEKANDILRVYLREWGESIKWDLVKGEVPIIPNRGKRGVDKIVITSTNDNYVVQENFSGDVLDFRMGTSQKGALELLNIFDFKRLYFLNLDFNRTRLSSIRVGKNKLVVKNQNHHIDADSLIKDDVFVSKVKEVEKLLGQNTSLLDKVYNSLRFSPFVCSSKGEILVQMLILLKTAYHHLKNDICISVGGIDSDLIKKNIIILGGEIIRVLDNESLALLLGLSAINTKGVFGVYVDKYGVFEILQKAKKNALLDLDMNWVKIYKKKYYLNIGLGQNIKTDSKIGEIAARVSIHKKGVKNEFFPLYNRITSSKLDEVSDVFIKTEDEFDIGNKSSIKLNRAQGRLIIDSRPSSLDHSIENSQFIKDVLVWIDGLLEEKFK